MKSHCTLALVGFSSDDTKSIKEVVLKSYLDLRIEFLQVVKNEENSFEAKMDEDYDIIILSADGYSTPIEHIIQTLKTRFPLTEIVIVSKTRNYDIALKAFRSGARDVLEYPFKDSDFLNALERSQSYRALYKNSQSLTDILTLFNQFGDFKRFNSLFDLMGKIDDFVLNKFQSLPFLILSLSKKVIENGKVEGHFRTLWNKNLIGDFYQQKDFDYIFSVIKPEELLDTSQSHYRFLDDGKYYFLIPLEEYEQSCNFGFFVIDEEKYTDYVAKIVGHLCRILQNGFQQHLLQKAQEDLTALVHNDDVTGLYNQRKLQIDLDDAIAEFEKNNEPFSIIFIDIDHFKSVNDGHGHLVGSQLLVEVANVLKVCLRDNDLIYRYGGDEFVILVPGIRITDAKSVGERILKEIKAYKFVTGKNKNLKLTVSIGVAEFPRDAQTKEDVMEMADDMMYKAKNAGRGQVVTTEEIFNGLEDSEDSKDSKESNEPDDKPKKANA